MGLEGITTQAQARAAQAERDAAATAAEGDEAAPASATTTTAATAQAWPSTLPEQVRAVAQLLSTSPTPLALPAIEASFKGKGPWKKSLPRILDTLEALGRARLEGSGWRGYAEAGLRKAIRNAVRKIPRIILKIKHSRVPADPQKDPRNPPSCLTQGLTLVLCVAVLSAARRLPVSGCAATSLLLTSLWWCLSADSEHSSRSRICTTLTGCAVQVALGQHKSTAWPPSIGAAIKSMYDRNHPIRAS